MSQGQWKGFVLKTRNDPDKPAVAVIKSGYRKGEYICLSRKNTAAKKIVVNGHIQQIPFILYERDTLFICGASGSGKSTYASEFSKIYKKMYPKNKLVLISPKPEDSVLDRLNFIRIKLSDDNWINDNKLTINELENCLVLFDDVEGVTDKLIKKAINDLRDEILVLGRSKNITCITVSHQITSGTKDTKIPCIESQWLVFFPQQPNYQLNRYLKEYVGLDPKQIKYLRKLPTRAVALHKNMPYFVLTKDSAEIITDDD